MKVLWYYPFPHREPNPVAVELVRRGHQLTVLVPRMRDVDHFEESSRYQVVPALPEPGSIGGRPIKTRLFRQIRLAQRQCSKTVGVLRWQPDIVDFHLLEHHVDWLTLRLIRRLTNARLVGMVHDVVPHAFHLPIRTETWLLSKLYEPGCLDQLTVYHDALAHTLTGEFGVDPSRITVVPMFIKRVDRPKPPPIGGRLKVLCIGTLRENKGIDVLIDAIGRLPESDRLHFTIAGGGSEDLESSVRSLAAKRRDVDAEIGWYSHDRKRELLMEADLLVLPYTSFHSQSGVLRDAYQYGIPLLVTDVGALGHTVNRDGSGWVVPPDDAGALLEALDEIAESPRELNIRAANVERAAARLSPERVADRLEVAYGVRPDTDADEHRMTL